MLDAQPSHLEQLPGRARVLAGLILDRLADASEARTVEDRARHLDGIAEAADRLMAAIDRATPARDE